MAWTDKNRSGQYNSTQTCGVDMMGLERQKQVWTTKPTLKLSVLCAWTDKNKSGQQNQHSSIWCWYELGQTKINLDSKINTQACDVNMCLDRQNKSGQLNQHSILWCWYAFGQTKTRLDNKTNTSGVTGRDHRHISSHCH